MDALGEYVDRRKRQWTWALTITSSLIAIVVEISVISRVWINPIPGHSGFSFDVIPVFTALPLLLCLSMQLGVRKARKSGDISSKMADAMEIAGGILIMIIYQAIGDLMRLLR
jgi:hypothetical protein